MKLVYILLPVHNRREVTRRFVKCLKAQTYRDYHLLLLDDGSTDGTATMVSAELANVTVLSGNGDWWWAGALQQGYEWLQNQPVDADDLVMIANDDTEFAPDFLERAVRLMEGVQKTLVQAQPFSRQTGRLIGSGVRVDWRRVHFPLATSPEEIDCLSTRGLFMTVGDFLSLGGFYPRLLPHYLSDYEFTLRAARRGMRLWTDASLRLTVDEQTTGFHDFSEETFAGFLKKYFAKNSDANPVAWSAFLLLACPWRWKLLGLLRVWYGTFVKLVTFLLPGRTGGER